jgi:glutathione synthase
MKIGIVVNDILTELDDYTTTHLAMAATNMGHEVWYMSVGDMVYELDGHCYAHVRQMPQRHFRSSTVYLKALQGESAQVERISLCDLDVLLLRNDPGQDVNKRPWARLVGINFGRLAVRRGVIVLNDPDGLAQAINKMYLLSFPEEVRPKTVISRDRNDIKNFIAAQGGNAVLKPLSGSGGRNVFLVRPEDGPNINQMIEAVSSEGYIIAQEYLPDAIHGDTRLFLMNGQPLMIDGKAALFRRVRQSGDPDMRSNMTAGAIAARGELNDTMLRLAELVRPRLVKDGLFLVGLDIVGDKLMEINVFSPGGLHCSEQLEGVPFCREVIRALERKVDYMHHYQTQFDNVKMATL